MTLHEAREVLGVSAGDSPEYVKAKFREHAKRLHPDVNKIDTPDEAERKFKRLNEANEILKSGKSSSKEGSDENDFFGNLEEALKIWVERLPPHLLKFLTEHQFNLLGVAPPGALERLYEFKEKTVDPNLAAGEYRELSEVIKNLRDYDVDYFIVIAEASKKMPWSRNHEQFVKESVASDFKAFLDVFGPRFFNVENIFRYPTAFREYIGSLSTLTINSFFQRLGGGGIYDAWTEIVGARQDVVEQAFRVLAKDCRSEREFRLLNQALFKLGTPTAKFLVGIETLKNPFLRAKTAFLYKVVSSVELSKMNLRLLNPVQTYLGEGGYDLRDARFFLEHLMKSSNLDGLRAFANAPRNIKYGGEDVLTEYQQVASEGILIEDANTRKHFLDSRLSTPLASKGESCSLLFMSVLPARINSSAK